MTDTHISRLTPPLPSAIATLSVRGPLAQNLVLDKIQLRSQTLEVDRIYYGLFHTGAEDTQQAEQVVVCQVAEQEIEIHCHGGNAICNALIRAFNDAGCTLIRADEFCALHNQSSQAAAETELIHATTDRAAAILLDQVNGALDIALESIKTSVNEANWPAARKLINRLLEFAPLGLHLSNPWKIVFAGPPNAGKSSLINAIVGRQQSIVHHLPGTTRDWVESRTAIAGWPVSLRDTAGLRSSDDMIESEGVRQAFELIQWADLIVLVIDAGIGWTEMHSKILSLAECSDRKQEAPGCIICVNKTDVLPAENDLSDHISGYCHAPIVFCSAIADPGFAPLLKSIEQSLVPCLPATGEAIPFLPAQVEWLRKILQAIDSENQSEAQRLAAKSIAIGIAE